MSQAVAVPSPVVPVWIYWLGGGQTLTGRQQTRTKGHGNDGMEVVLCHTGRQVFFHIPSRKLGKNIRHMNDSSQADWCMYNSESKHFLLLLQYFIFNQFDNKYAHTWWT